MGRITRVGKPSVVAYALTLRSVAYVSHQLLDLRFQVSSQWQQWQSDRASEVAVEIHCVFHAGDAQPGNYSRRGLVDSQLFQPSQFQVAFFPGSIDFVTSGWSCVGESENRAYCS